MKMVMNFKDFLRKIKLQAVALGYTKMEAYTQGSCMVDMECSSQYTEQLTMVTGA